MAIQRRTYRLRTSWVVALPREIRAHLKLRGGEDVYWHVTGPGEVALTKTVRREGGRPSVDRLQRAILAGREREERLMRRVHQAPAAQYARGEQAGFTRALQHFGFGPRWTAEVMKVLYEVERQVSWLAAKQRYERHGARRSIKRLRPVDAMPLPDSLPSPDVSGGDAASGPEEVPGRP